nr:hypothetical protein B0A51_15940 [Rachicladosporium sp. CCFEE 5018]
MSVAHASSTLENMSSYSGDILSEGDPSGASDDWITESDDSDASTVFPTAVVDLDQLAQLCEGYCGACDLLRTFERANDQKRALNIRWQRAKTEFTWDSRKALRKNARSCSFCAYLLDRSNNANLWPTRKTERFPKTAGSLRLVHNGHRVRSGKFLVTDLRSTGYAGLVSLAFKRHTTPSVHVGIRQVGPLFDTEIGKAWLSRCVKDHDHSYENHRDDDHEADSGSPSALQALMDEGGLIAASIELPIAVQDAIVGAASLGFKHIWIDALCIVEDDELDKAAQIGSMRTICRQAALTIVSTAPSVHDSISGINSVPRSLTQRSFRTARFDLIDRLPGVHNMLDHCAWYTRGWTLQEMLLSHRLLISTEAQVLFMCLYEIVWYEDDMSAHKAGTESIGVAGYREPHALAQDPEGIFEDCTHLMGSSAPAVERYTELMSDYQARKVKYPGDNLNAVAGMLETIGDCLWGLPRAFFIDALCRTAKRPYDDSSKKYSTHMRPLAQFPSWSWAAWKAPGTVLTIMDSDRASTSVVAFSALIEQNGKAYHRAVTCRKGPGCTSNNTCIAHLADVQALDADLDSHPEILHLMYTPPALSILRFRSYIADFYVPRSPEISPDRGSSAYFTVYADAAMQLRLTGLLLEPAWRALQGETLSFLYVGACGDGKLIFLLIEMRDGIAYRRPEVIYIERYNAVWQPAVHRIVTLS